MQGCSVVGRLLSLLTLLVAVVAGHASPQPSVDPFDIPQGAYQAEHVRDTDHLSVISFVGDYNRYLGDGRFNAAARAVVAQEFFRTHPDNYDFLVVFTAFEFDSGDATAFHVGVRNDIEGLGMPLYDNGVLFGSDERLQSYIDMAALSRYEFNPLQPEFSGTGNLLAHEVLHRWGIRTRYIDQGGNESTDLLGHGDSHWSFFLNSGASVEYGHQWQDNGDGTFTATAARRFYSPLDLYLMGINEASEVPDFFLINPADATYEATQLPVQGAVVSGTREDISIADIVAAEGQRIPAAADAPKQFRMGFVVLVPPGEDISPEQTQNLNQLRNQFAQRFSIMTGGRGIMHVYPEALPVAALGSQDGVGDGSELVSTVDAELGLQWLRDAQRPAGNWEDTENTRMRDTTTVHRALVELDGDYNPFLGETWLTNNTASNTDSLARQVLALEPSVAREQAIERLRSLPVTNGGVGVADGYAESVIDSALALRALRVTTNARYQSRINFLVGQQNPNGSWSALEGGPDSVGTTVAVLRALLGVTEQTATVDAAVDWLVAQQRVDGGFGDDSSSVHESSAVGLALVAAGEISRIDEIALSSYVASQQTITGAWENSSYTTAVALQYLQAASFANLAVTQFTASDASVVDGEVVFLSGLITNASSTAAGASDAQFYLGEPGPGATPIGAVIPLPAIPAFGAVTVQGVWDSLGFAGDALLALQVDSAGSIAESTKSDNIARLEVTVQPAVAGVDLYVSAQDVVADPANPTELPVTIGVSGVVRNLGSADANGVVVQVQTADGTVLAQQTIDVPNRASQGVNLTYVLTESADQTLALVVDADGSIAEADETNNTASFQVTPVQTVDLEVLSGDLGFSPSPAVLFEESVFTVNIRNRGTEASPAADIRFSVVQGGVAELLQTNSISLNGGESTSIEVVWNTNRDVDAFRVEIDPDNAVPETSETNNIAEIAVDTTQLMGTNVATSFRNLNFDPNPAFEAMGTTLSGLVTNTGTEVATSVEAVFYDGEPANDDVIGSVTIPSLQPGASIPVQVVWGNIPDARDRIVYLRIDPNQTIAEFNEDDNQAFAELVVVSLPDLEVSAGSLVFSPQFPKNNDTLVVQASVTNTGMQTATDVVVRAYIGGVAPGNEIGSQTIPAMGAFATITLDFTTVLSMEGTETVTVMIDPDDTVLESDENNNTGERTISVQNGDFFVSQRYISPDGDGIQDSTRYSFRVDAPGEFDVVVLDELHAIVRRFDAANHDGSSIDWDGRSDGGGIVLDGPYQFAVELGEDRYLGQRTVVVDTNRSALLDALGTEFGFQRNLTCTIGDVLERNGLEFNREKDLRGLAYGPNDEFVLFKTFLSPFFEDGELRETNESVFYPSGLYLARPDGTSVRPLAEQGGDVDVRNITHIAVSDDGLKVAYVVSNLSGSQDYRVMVVNTDGSDEINLYEGSDDVGALAFLPGSHTLVLAEIDSTTFVLRSIDVDSQSVEEVARIFNFSIGALSAREVVMQPNATGSHVAILVRSRFEFLSTPGELLGERHGAAIIPLDGSDVVRLGGFVSSLGWSPTGALLAAADIRANGVVLYDTAGNVIQQFEFPSQFSLPPGLSFDDLLVYVPDELRDGLLGEFAGLAWNPDGTELAVLFEDFSATVLANEFVDPFDGISEDDYGDGSILEEELDFVNLSGVHLLNVLENTREHVALTAHLPYFADGDGGGCNDCVSYHIFSVDGAGEQTKLTEMHFTRHYTQRYLQLTPELLAAADDGQLNLKMVQVGHEEAHIDAIALLDSAGRPTFPSAFTGEEGDRLDLVSALDKRVLDATHATFEFSFDVSGFSAGEEVALAMIAREATLSTLGVEPFAYQQTDGKPLRFELGSQQRDLALAFRELSRPDTGHPSATVSGYIGSDADSLLGRLEFAVDNTMGNPADWAALHVEVDGHWREFKVTEALQQYGSVEFSASDLVRHEHKIYHFDIPLAELGLQAGDALNYRYLAYGSAGLVPGDGGASNFPVDENGVPRAPDGRPYLHWVDDEFWMQDDLRNKQFDWVQGSRAVLITGPDNGTDDTHYVVGFDQRTVTRRLFAERQMANHRTINTSNAGKYLYFFSDDTTDLCAGSGQTQGYRQFESLLNLTADLRAVRSATEGGVQLKGTAADANFATYSLDYATAAEPDTWIPVAPDSSESVVDGNFTTWVPPQLGAYFVRLTVRDQAGNTRQAISRTAITDTPSISDVSTSQRSISPNGDGTQDVVSIDFTVREPANVEVFIYNTDGDLVRTIFNSYTNIGAQESIVWNGFDNNGERVQDGFYQIDVNNYVYDVVVDTKAPAAAFAFTGIGLLGYEAEPISDRLCEFRDRADLRVYDRRKTLPLDEADFKVFADRCAMKANTQMYFRAPGARELILQSRELGATDWDLDQVVTSADGVGGLQRPAEALSNREYRLLATDHAGNTGVAAHDYGNLRNQALMTLAGPLEISGSEVRLASVLERNPGESMAVDLKYYKINKTVRFREAEPILIRVVETLPADIVAVEVMVGPYPKDADLSLFQPTAVQGYAVGSITTTPQLENRTDGEFSVVWDPAEYPELTAEPYRVFVRLTDVDGNVVSTNSFRIEPESFGIRGSVGISRRAESYSNPFTPADATQPRLNEIATLDVRINGYERDEIERVTVNVTSSSQSVDGEVTDPLFAERRQLDSFVPNGNRSLGRLIDGELTHTFFLDASELRQCTNYRIEASYLLKDGRRVSIDSSVRAGCVLLELSAFPIYPEQCNAPSRQERLVTAFWRPDVDPGEERDLEYTRQVLLTVGVRPEGSTAAPDILFNVNDPVASPRGGELDDYQFVLDISGYTEDQELVVELLDENGRSESVSLPLPIVATPPVARLEQPGFCPDVWRRSGDGEESFLLGLQGYIETEQAHWYRIVGSIDGEELPLPVASGSSREEALFFANRDGANSFGSSRTRVSDGLRVRLPPQITYRDKARTSGFLSLIGQQTGTAELTLEVFDYSGVKQCTTIEFDLDVEVEGFGAGLLPGGIGGFYSPNGDGVFDDIIIEFNVDEDATLNLELFDHRLVPQPGNLPPKALPDQRIGQPIVELPITSGFQQVSWDGTNNGTLVEDDLYFLRLTVRDACGVTVVRDFMVKIDNTPPEVSLTYPLPGDQIGLIVEPRGEVSDVNLQGAQLSANDVPIGQRVAKGRSTLTGVFGTWNTYGVEGGQTLTLTGIDHAGNRTVEEIVLALPVRTDLISELDITRIFSPNGDGRLDASAIRVQFEAPLTATVEILHPATGLVRTLVADEPFGIGQTTLLWDGRNDVGEIASDAVYLIRVSVESSETPGLTQTAERTSTLDNTLPAISVTNAVSGVVSLLGDLSAPVLLGSITDANFALYSVVMVETPGGASLDTLAGSENAPAVTLAEIAPELLQQEGDYRVRISAEDDAENVIQTNVIVRVDITPPVVELTVPDSGAGFRLADATEIAVEGLITEGNLATYSVLLIAGSTGGSAVFEQTFTTLPGSSHLGVIPLAGVPDGEYRVSVLAVDLGGLQTRSEIPVFVDNTPPVVSINQPGANGFFTAAGDIVGTAQDANLIEYQLGLANGIVAEDANFNRLAVGSDNKNNASLYYWSELPADGPYTLRLTANDAVGNQSVIIRSFTLDTIPPPQPVISSVLLDKPTQDVTVSWAAVEAEDLAGYRVLRNGNLLTGPSLQNELSYVDTGVPEGEYQYQVQAVDLAGLESDLSAPYQISVDVTPPDASLIEPVDGVVVGGLVTVSGRAFSADDFAEYVVSVGITPGSLTEVARSSLPVPGGELAQLSTLTLTDNQVYIVELRASDVNDNEATSSVTVTIDNQPPAAPTDLIATATDNDVALSWTPSGDVDVLGYLVYRGDRLINVEVAIGDLRPYAVPGTSADDNDVPDGTYEYRVVTIDNAGNLSAPSAPAEATIDTRAPRALFVVPSPGEEFEDSLFVHANVEDNDVAQVVFEYRATGGPAWLPLITDTSEPFSTLWDTSALAYANYELRATATDTNNNTDSAPAIVSASKIDLTRPQMVAGLIAAVQGGQVSLSWDAANDADVAGYFVERRELEETEFTRVTPTAVTETTFVETDVDDGDYFYTVVAVDTSDNEAEPAEPQRALVFTPVLSEPFSPTTSNGIVLQGSTVPDGVVTATVDSDQGTTSAGANADSDGSYSVPAVLAIGSNALTVTVTHEDGFVSKPASTSVRRAEVPSQVTGLGATLDGTETQVDLTWNANPESDIAGYRLYRNGEGVTADVQVTPVAAASTSVPYSSTYAPSRVLDDVIGLSSYWAPLSPHEAEIDVSLSEAAWITQVDVHWANEGFTPLEFDVLAFDGDRFVTLARFRDAPEQMLNEVILAEPYYSDRVRVQILRHRFGEEANRPVRLSEIDITTRPIVAATTATDTPPNGNHDYSVSAVNTAGFEGVVSEVASIEFGDFLAPDAVTLSGTVAGSDVTLNWSNSTAPDFATYQLLRNGELISDQSGTGYADTGLLNGAYNYVVRVVDQQGNQSDDSNVVSILVDVGSLPAPQNLIATPAPDGSARLDLTWQPAASGDAPAGYQLERSSDGVTFEVIGLPDGLSTSDDTLSYAVAYQYQVRARDAIGNVSGPSNVVDVAIYDLVPPDRPVLMAPTISGMPITVDSQVIDVIGTADPDSDVYLLKNGLPEGPARAAPVSGLITEAGSEVKRIVVSPTDRVAALLTDANDADRVVVFEQNAWRELTNHEVAGFLSINDIAWHGEQVVMLIDPFFDALTPIRAVSLDGEISSIVSMQPFTSGLVQLNGVIGYRAASNSLVVYAGSFENRIIEILLATGQVLDVGVSSASRWSEFASLSPDGARMAYVEGDTATQRVLRVYEFVSGAVTEYAIPSQAVADTRDSISWFADSDRVALITNAGGDDQVSVYRISDGSVTPLFADVRGDVAAARMSAYDSQVFYRLRTGSEELASYVDLAEARISDLYSTPAVGVMSAHAANNAGQFFFGEVNAGLRAATPAGQFYFPMVALPIGENEIVAFAFDPSGNVSQDSTSIEVSRLADELPDLAVSMQIDRPLPMLFDDVPISLTISNNGLVASEATNVTIDVVTADGNREQIIEQTLLPIGPGLKHDLGAVWTAAVLGDYVVVAAVDTDDEIAEQSENNNSVFKRISVVSDALPILELSLLPSRFGDTGFVANEALAGILDITNAGPSFAGTALVQVQDADGFTVSQVLQQPIESLLYGQTLSFDLNWNTATTFPGEYALQAELFNQNGELVDAQHSSFTIDVDLDISASVTTDRTLYPLQTPVAITARVFNETINGAFEGGSVQLVITDALNNEVLNDLRPLNQLFAGETLDVQFDWNTAAFAPGQYDLSLVIADADGATVAQSSAELEILRGAPQLSGSLATGTPSLAQGAALDLQYLVENLGNSAVNDLSLNFSLSIAGATSVLEALSVGTSLAVAESSSGSIQFATQALPIGSYEVRMEYVVRVDGVDYTGFLERLLIDVRDTTPPELELLRPLEGGYINSQQVDLEVLADDADNAIAQVLVGLDGAEAVPMQRGLIQLNQYQFDLNGLAEGMHAGSVSASDIAGNTSAPLAVSFTVDNTPPVVDVTGVVDGEIYSAAVAPTIDATDANLSLLEIQLNTGPYISGALIAADGEYRLVVSAEDAAGNATYSIVLFEIDSVAATIVVDGVDEGGNYNTPRMPVITITDDNLASSTITLDGQPFTSGSLITSEGDHVLEVSATDTAGNVSTLTISFSIDLTAPDAPLVSEPLNGEVFNAAVTDVVGSSEADAIVQLTTSAGGSFGTVADGNGAFLFSQVALGPDTTDLTLTATDRAGNVSPQTTLSVSVATGGSDATLTGSLSAAPSILIWAPERHGHYHPHCYGGSHGGHRDDYAHYNDDLEAVVDLLSEAYTEAGIRFELVRNRWAFKARLRSHAYNSLVVVDLDGSRSHRMAISGFTALELRAAVASGMGLQFITTRPGSMQSFRDVLGAKARRRVPHVEGLDMSDSPASVAASWGLDGEAVKLSNRGGLGVGHINYQCGQSSCSYPAMVINQYGEGDTAILGFNPASISDRAGAKQLLKLVAGYIAPDEPVLVPNGVAETRWLASDLSPPVEIEIVQALESELAHIEAIGGDVLDERTARWLLSLSSEDATEVASLVQVPELAGTYRIDGSVFDAATQSLLTSAELDVVVDEDLEALEARLVAAIRALSVHGHKRHIRNHAEYAALWASNIPLTSAWKLEWAIFKLSLAVHDLKRLGATDEVAIAGELMRSYHALWSAFVREYE